MFTSGCLKDEASNWGSLDPVRLFPVEQLMHGLTNIYPTVQPETIMPIAVPTRRDPNVLLTTIGTVENHPPLESPLTMANTSVGPREVEAGQMTKRLIALITRVRKSEFMEPIASHE